MGHIHIAGISIPVPDEVAISIYARAREVIDLGKFETMSLDLPNGGGAAFIVGPGHSLAITTDNAIDASTFEAQGIVSRTVTRS